MTEPVAPTYHVLALRDGEDPLYAAYPDRARLREGLIKLRPSVGGGRLTAYVFRGDRLLTTRPPFSYLLEPDQEPLALFEVPGPGEVDEAGTLTADVEAAPVTDYARLTQVGLADDHQELADLDGQEQDEPLKPEGSE